MKNPFYYGGPVPFNLFHGRENETLRLLERIYVYGQSSALVGDPRIGKSSILKYIQSQNHSEKLLPGFSGDLFFSYLDAQSFGSDITPAKFWHKALLPLKEKKTLKSFSKIRENAENSNYDSYILEQYFRELYESNARLALLIDEFDSILHHPILHTSSFYGGLRSLASLSEGALSVTIATRLSLDNLNLATQVISKTGSPFFNIMDEIFISPFSAEEAFAFLSKGKKHFTKEDYHWLSEITGGHPYLLQVASATLWEMYERDESDKNYRENYVNIILRQEAKKTIENVWAMWSNEQRLAFSSIALDENPLLLKNRNFDLITIIKKLSELAPELYELEQRGYIMHAPDMQSQWEIRIKVFSWWLADKLQQDIRENVPFEQWIALQEWDNVWNLTKSEKAKGKKFFSFLFQFLQEILSFIKTTKK